jgi:hypothetical protein
MIQETLNKPDAVVRFKKRNEMKTTALMPVRALGSLGCGAVKTKKGVFGGPEEANSGEKRWRRKKGGEKDM